MKSRVIMCNVFVKKASLYLEKMSPMFICLWINCWHPPVKLATPLQGGGKNSQGVGKKLWIASLAICHPPEQNAETAPVS